MSPGGSPPCMYYLFTYKVIHSFTPAKKICRKTYLSIQIEMLTIIKWLAVNKLSLNIEKTKIIIFDNIKFAVKINLANGYSIEECKSIKYLGLIVDNLLKFDLHIEHIKSKIQK